MGAVWPGGADLSPGGLYFTEQQTNSVWNVYVYTVDTRLYIDNKIIPN